MTGGGFGRHLNRVVNATDNAKRGVAVAALTHAAACLAHHPDSRILPVVPSCKDGPGNVGPVPLAAAVGAVIHTCGATLGVFKLHRQLRNQIS